MIQPNFQQVNKLLRRSRTIDTYFLIKYTCAPYRACQHACMYCDGRAEKYYVEGDFERDIVVRANFAERLRIELPKQKERGVVFLSSGVTDPYQPIEKEQRLMADASAVLAEMDYPVAVMTKSNLALRDIDNWQKVNERGGFMLMVSLTTLDDGVRRIFEPGASSVEERIEMIRRFKEAGCVVGISAMPFLPLISDTEESLTAFYRKMEEIGVDYVLSAGLTLRPGVQKDCYMRVIRAHYPHLEKEYERIYRHNRASGSMDAGYAKEVYDRFARLTWQSSFSPMVPHSLYRDWMHIYDSVSVLLHHMIELYQARQIDVRRLKQAVKRYDQWLDEERRYLYRKRKATSLELERKLVYLAESGELNHLLGNRKLADFLGKVIVEKKVFDYRELKLLSTS